MNDNHIKIVTFSNQTREDRKLLKKFINFHWKHYRNEPQYIPLLDYEYLGSRLIGITGFFEPQSLFFKHAEMIFFLALTHGKVTGRCNAFINHHHNAHWKDKTGFFGQFEAVDDVPVTRALLSAAGDWLKSKGMDTIRGPQNLPVNEATPGLMTGGFDSRPVVYYHYNKPYYERLLEACGFAPVKKVFSWEVPAMLPMEEKLVRVAEKVMKRKGVTLETWDQRPLDERKREMLDIYNEAWSDNYGFVPVTEEEFYKIVDDMQLIIDKGQFAFAYVGGEPAAFFGALPNIFDKMRPIPGLRRFELLRAAKMFLFKKSIKGLRLAYLGVKKKFRNLGLEGILLWNQKKYTQSHGYEYSDIGWVLDDNEAVIRMVGMMKDVKLSRTYTIFEKSLLI